MPCSPKDLAWISTRWHECGFIWYETARLARRRALQVGDVAIDGPGVAHDRGYPLRATTVQHGAFRAVSKRVLNEQANRRTNHCTHDHVMSTVATWVPATIRASEIAKTPPTTPPTVMPMTPVRQALYLSAFTCSCTLRGC